MYGSQPYGAAAFAANTTTAAGSLPAPSGGSSKRFLLFGLRALLVVLLPLWA